MKKITDERLKVRNLKNLRLAFVVENVFLYGVLIWQLIQGRGISAVLDWGNVPFAAVFIGGITSAVLSVNVSEPMADKPRRATRRLLRNGLIAWVVFGLFFYWLIQAPLTVTHLALAVGCGLLLALVWTGIDAWGNHFRSKDDDE